MPGRFHARSRRTRSGLRLAGDEALHAHHSPVLPISFTQTELTTAKQGQKLDFPEVFLWARISQAIKDDLQNIQINTVKMSLFLQNVSCLYWVNGMPDVVLLNYIPHFLLFTNSHFDTTMLTWSSTSVCHCQMPNALFSSCVLWKPF